jgi:hypothetical protein
MTLPTNTTTSYSLVGIREDLKDFIANISPTDTPFTASVGTAEATNTYFEWQTDALAAPNTSNAQLEGDDLGALAVVATSRIGNRTQISTKGIIVSGTSEAVNKAGRTSELAYQIRKRTLELKRDVEAIITQNQASATGSASVARTTGSLEAWFVTNTSRGASGANGGFASGNVAAATDGTQRALTESFLKTIYQSVWTAGGNPTTLMVGATQKQNVSTFTGNVTRMQEATSKTLMTSIDVYESDFGAVKVVPNRFQRNRTAFLLQTDMWKLAYLRPYQIKDIAPTGDSMKKELIVEYGLMSMNEAASGVIADLV